MRIIVAVLTAGIIAGIGVIIGGTVVLFSNPCFNKQFPPAYCTPANSGLDTDGWWVILAGVLTVIGCVVAAAAAGSVRRAVRRRNQI